MTDQRAKSAGKTGEKPNASNANLQKNEPGWANGLRDFYSSIVAEPLPDSFDDLLRQLEAAEEKNKSN